MPKDPDKSEDALSLAGDQKDEMKENDIYGLLSQKLTRANASKPELIIDEDKVHDSNNVSKNEEKKSADASIEKKQKEEPELESKEAEKEVVVEEQILESKEQQKARLDELPEDKISSAKKPEGVSIGGSYSYEEDFEPASMPATSKDVDYPQEKAPQVEEQPSEEDKSSDAPQKVQIWSE